MQLIEELQDFVADVFRRDGAEGGVREGAFQRGHGCGHIVGGDFGGAFAVVRHPVHRRQQVFVEGCEECRLLFGSGFRHHQPRLGDAAFAAEGVAPDFVEGEAALHVHACLFAFEGGGARQRFGQERVRVVFLQEQRHGFGRGGGVGDEAIEVDAVFFREDLQDDVRHIVFEGHDEFLPGKAGEVADGACLAHHRQQAARHDVVQEYRLALRAQVGGDVARYDADFDAFVEQSRAQLVGVLPAFHGERADVARFAHLCRDGEQHGRGDGRPPQGEGFGGAQRQGAGGGGCGAELQEAAAGEVTGHGVSPVVGDGWIYIHLERSGVCKWL